MDEALQIVNDIRKGVIKPIYFLYGEEPYYIDKISDYIAQKVLTEEERSFNQMILYGKDVSIDDIVGNAKRYPMMAEKQVVIVKEAQHLSRTIQKLSTYVDNLQQSTVLVICYKYKKLDKRTSLYKSLRKQGVIFESQTLRDYHMPPWIIKTGKNFGFVIPQKSAMLLAEHLGTDLGRIVSELNKLKLMIPQGTEITPSHIEEYIGISKDYNNFELKKAIGERNVLKATKIINYFAQNPKDNPFVLTITLLHMFFTQLLQYHGLTDKSSKNVKDALKINPYFVNEIKNAAHNYPMKRVSQIISHLRDMDLKSKGVGAASSNQADLLKELLVKLF